VARAARRPAKPAFAGTMRHLDRNLRQVIDHRAQCKPAVGPCPGATHGARWGLPGRRQGRLPCGMLLPVLRSPYPFWRQQDVEQFRKTRCHPPIAGRRRLVCLARSCPGASIHFSATDSRSATSSRLPPFMPVPGSRKAVLPPGEKHRRPLAADGLPMCRPACPEEPDVAAEGLRSEAAPGLQVRRPTIRPATFRQGLVCGNRTRETAEGGSQAHAAGGRRPCRAGLGKRSPCDA
jgi:hypothetical protein